MASFLEENGYRKKEVKLEEWGLPSVMVRELFGDEAEQLREFVAADTTLTENAVYRKVVAMGCVSPQCTEEALLKKPCSVVKHIALQIQELGKMGAEEASNTEKN